MEQATGLEKKELEALMQGKEVILINAHPVTCYYCRFKAVRICPAFTVDVNAEVVYMVNLYLF